MNGAESPEEIIRLPATSNDEEGLKTVKATLALFPEVRDPDELDAATKNIGMPASLLNFYLATRVDLSSMPIGIGSAVYIPVQITKREGGRKSIYFLAQDDGEVLVGIYVTNEGIALRYMQRITGSSLPAQEGDVYITRIKNREGKEVYNGQARLGNFNSQTGHGHFNVSDPATGTVTLPGNDISSVCWFSMITYQPDFWPSL